MHEKIVPKKKKFDENGFDDITACRLQIRVVQGLPFSERTLQTAFRWHPNQSDRQWCEPTRNDSTVRWTKNFSAQPDPTKPNTAVWRHLSIFTKFIVDNFLTSELTTQLCLPLTLISMTSGTWLRKVYYESHVSQIRNEPARILENSGRNSSLFENPYLDQAKLRTMFQILRLPTCGPNIWNQKLRQNPFGLFATVVKSQAVSFSMAG